MKKSSFNTTYLVQLALLVAIILLMAFTPIGYIKTLGLEITLIVVPVTVGAVILGPKGGAILGFVFGLTSFIQCFGMSPFGSVLLGLNPFGCFMVCVPTRTLMGWLTGVIYKAMQGKNLKTLPHFVANLAGPLMNTIFFMGMLIVFFFQSDYIQGLAGGLNPLAFVFAFVGINGLIEAGVCFVVGTAISKVLTMALKRGI